MDESLPPRQHAMNGWLTKDRTVSALSWKLPDSAVVCQNLLPEKSRQPTAHVWDMLIKPPVKWKVLRQQSRVKVLCSRDFPQLTPDCEYMLCQAAWTVKRSQTVPRTPPLKLGLRVGGEYTRIKKSNPFCKVILTLPLDFFPHLKLSMGSQPWNVNTV